MIRDFRVGIVNVFVFRVVGWFEGRGGIFCLKRNFWKVKINFFWLREFFSYLFFCGDGLVVRVFWFFFK